MKSSVDEGLLYVMRHKYRLWKITLDKVIMFIPNGTGKYNECTDTCLSLYSLYIGDLGIVIHLPSWFSNKFLVKHLPGCENCK